MNFKTVERETRKIEKFLQGREWEIQGYGGIGSIIKSAQEEIERIQKRAQSDLLKKLAAYEKEAQRSTDNNVHTLWTQEHIPLTKREQQQSATDVRHIHAALVKIGAVE